MRYVFAVLHVVAKIDLSSMKTNHTSNDYLCKLEIKNTKDCVNWFNFFFVSNSR